jgi:hypothetical protein
MISVRTFAIVMMGAGVFAGAPSVHAQICDNDRFPCPVISEATTQENADARTVRSRSAKLHKKENQTAAAHKKESAKYKRDATVATVESDPPPAGASTGISQTVVQKPAADPIPREALSQNAAKAASSAIPRSPSDQTNEGLVAVRGAVWPALPNLDVVNNAAGAAVPETTQAVTAGAVIDANELNEIDRAAIAPPRALSWIANLLLILGASMIVASAISLLPRVRSRCGASRLSRSSTHSVTCSSPLEGRSAGARGQSRDLPAFLQRRSEATVRLPAAQFRSGPTAWAESPARQNRWTVTLVADSANSPPPRFFARVFSATCRRSAELRAVSERDPHLMGRPSCTSG